MSTTHDSLILAGFSGVGKDTLYNSLANDFPQVYSVKFSRLTKDILAQAFRVPSSFLDGFDDEPKWREIPLYANEKQTEVTPLLLLQALFHGAPYTSLHKLNIKYALESISKDSFPVFTDVRRLEEYKAIVEAGYNPLFIYLRRDDVKPGEADGEVLTLAEDEAHEFLVLTKGREQENYATLKTRVQKLTKLTPAKPTLHVYVGCSPFSVVERSRPNYEPMQALLDKTRAALQLAYNLPPDVLNKRTVDLFQALVAETDLSEVELTPITSDCWMAFNDSYLPLLPCLREMARLKFISRLGAGVIGTLGLTKKEWDDVEFI